MEEGEKETNQHLQTHTLHTQPQHQREWHQRVFLKLLWLRSPLVGYCICPLLTVIALFVQLALQRLGLGAHTATTGFYLSTVIVAWLWGIGPALLASLLGYIALEGFVVPPNGIFTFNGWSDITLYLPFFIVQLLVVSITWQRERARQEAQTQAQELERVNQILEQVNQTLVHSNQQLERANQLKDIFLSQVSHELKNPVTAIRGQAHLVLRRLTKSQQTAPEMSSLQISLKRIEAQTSRLHTLIDDLLDIGSLRSGKLLVRLAPCDFGSLCREVIEEQRLLLDRWIELELPSSPVILQADGQRLTQVIINLISNAVKYSLENTIVLVTVLQEATHVLFAIHNEGSVIPREHQASLFEPFYRTPQAEYLSIEGRGLGLSVSKEIVERHGGEIWVESSEGKGTTFFVHLPLQCA